MRPAEPATKADRGHHPSFPGVNVFAGGPGRLAWVLGHRKLATMSEKHLPKESGSIPTGAVGLVLTVIFCVAIAVSPGGFFSVFLKGALGLVGLVISIVGIAKRSGRAAGVFGILAFILGCLMTYSTVLDMIAHERGHSG